MPLRPTAAFLRRTQVNVRKEIPRCALVFFLTSLIVLVVVLVIVIGIAASLLRRQQGIRIDPETLLLLVVWEMHFGCGHLKSSIKWSSSYISQRS